MKAVRFKLKFSSLYSIRLPYTFQSALTYPVMPPSSIIGMLANALHRYRKDDPLRCLNEVKQKVKWSGSRLMEKCIVKSQVVSTIKESGEPDALSREFAFSKEGLEILVIVEDDFSNDICESLKNAPITGGDGESIAFVEELEEVNIQQEVSSSRHSIDTKYPVVFYRNRVTLCGGDCKIYLFPDYGNRESGGSRRSRESRGFLIPYLVPVKQVGNVFCPTEVKVEVNLDEGGSIYEVDGDKIVVISL